MGVVNAFQLQTFWLLIVNFVASNKGLYQLQVVFVCNHHTVFLHNGILVWIFQNGITIPVCPVHNGLFCFKQSVPGYEY